MVFTKKIQSKDLEELEKFLEDPKTKLKPPTPVLLANKLFSPYPYKKPPPPSPLEKYKNTKFFLIYKGQETSIPIAAIFNSKILRNTIKTYWKVSVADIHRKKEKKWTPLHDQKLKTFKIPFDVYTEDIKQENLQNLIDILGETKKPSDLINTKELIKQIQILDFLQAPKILMQEIAEQIIQKINDEDIAEILIESVRPETMNNLFDPLIKKLNIFNNLIFERFNTVERIVEKIKFLKILPNGSIASASENGIIKIWDSKTRKSISKFQIPSEKPLTLINLFFLPKNYITAIYETKEDYNWETEERKGKKYYTWSWNSKSNTIKPHKNGAIRPLHYTPSITKQIENGLISKNENLSSSSVSIFDPINDKIIATKNINACSTKIKILNNGKVIYKNSFGTTLFDMRTNKELRNSQELDIFFEKKYVLLSNNLAIFRWDKNTFKTLNSATGEFIDSLTIAEGKIPTKGINLFPLKKGRFGILVNSNDNGKPNGSIFIYNANSI